MEASPASNWKALLPPWAFPSSPKFFLPKLRPISAPRLHAWLKNCYLRESRFLIVFAKAIGQKVTAVADALTRASLPRQASDGPQTRIKVEAVEGSDLVAQAITVLAPHVLTLPSKARQAAQGAIKAEMNNLPPDRLAELRRFLAKGSLNRDTLALLSLKARAGVLKIHYVTCKPWSSLALEDRKPEKLRTWLEQNLPDYRALEPH